MGGGRAGGKSAAAGDVDTGSSPPGPTAAAPAQTQGATGGAGEPAGDVPQAVPGDPESPEDGEPASVLSLKILTSRSSTPPLQVSAPDSSGFFFAGLAAMAVLLGLRRRLA